MQDTIQPAVDFAPSENTIKAQARNFNFNKLQAVLCMAASAAVSVALIVWAINSLL